MVQLSKATQVASLTILCQGWLEHCDGNAEVQVWVGGPCVVVPSVAGNDACRSENKGDMKQWMGVHGPGRTFSLRRAGAPEGGWKLPVTGAEQPVSVLAPHASPTAQPCCLLHTVHIKQPCSLLWSSFSLTPKGRNQCMFRQPVQRPSKQSPDESRGRGGSKLDSHCLAGELCQLGTN